MISLMDNYFDRLKETIDKLDRKEISKFIDIMQAAKQNGHYVYIMGNGGSGATASHFVCDFNKGMSYSHSEKHRLVCLNDNISTMLAYANDVGYEDIFVEQLKNFLKPNDVVIAISGSGNSKNIIKAVNYANSKGAITVGFTGFSGGALKNIAKYSINTMIDDMQITEDIHMIICHMIYSITQNKEMNMKESLIHE